MWDVASAAPAGCEFCWPCRPAKSVKSPMEPYSIVVEGGLWRHLPPLVPLSVPPVFAVPLLANGRTSRWSASRADAKLLSSDASCRTTSFYFGKTYIFRRSKTSFRSGSSNHRAILLQHVVFQHFECCTISSFENAHSCCLPEGIFRSCCSKVSSEFEVSSADPERVCKRPGDVWRRGSSPK